MRESNVEQYLVETVRSMGGLAVKHTSPGRAGDPDRLVALPQSPCPHCGLAARVGLLELKAPGKTLRELQETRGQEWRAVGVASGWAATPVRVDAYLRVLAGEANVLREAPGALMAGRS